MKHINTEFLLTTPGSNNHNRGPHYLVKLTIQAEEKAVVDSLIQKLDDVPRLPFLAVCFKDPVIEPKKNDIYCITFNLSIEDFEIGFQNYYKYSPRPLNGYTECNENLEKILKFEELQWYVKKGDIEKTTAFLKQQSDDLLGELLSYRYHDYKVSAKDTRSILSDATEQGNFKLFQLLYQKDLTFNSRTHCLYAKDDTNDMLREGYIYIPRSMSLPSQPCDHYADLLLLPHTPIMIALKNNNIPIVNALINTPLSGKMYWGGNISGKKSFVHILADSEQYELLREYSQKYVLDFNSRDKCDEDSDECDEDSIDILLKYKKYSFLKSLLETNEDIIFNENHLKKLRSIKPTDSEYKDSQSLLQAFEHANLILKNFVEWFYKTFSDFFSKTNFDFFFINKLRTSAQIHLRTDIITNKKTINITYYPNLYLYDLFSNIQNKINTLQTQKKSLTVTHSETDSHQFLFSIEINLNLRNINLTELTAFIEKSISENSYESQIQITNTIEILLQPVFPACVVALIQGYSVPNASIPFITKIPDLPSRSYTLASGAINYLGFMETYREQAQHVPSRDLCLKYFLDNTAEKKEFDSLEALANDNKTPVPSYSKKNLGWQVIWLLSNIPGIDLIQNPIPHYLRIKAVIFYKDMTYYSVIDLSEESEEKISDPTEFPTRNITDISRSESLSKASNNPFSKSGNEDSSGPWSVATHFCGESNKGSGDSTIGNAGDNRLLSKDQIKQLLRNNLQIERLTSSQLKEKVEAIISSIATALVDSVQSKNSIRHLLFSYRQKYFRLLSKNSAHIQVFNHLIDLLLQYFGLNYQDFKIKNISTPKVSLFTSPVETHAVTPEEKEHIDNDEQSELREQWEFQIGLLFSEFSRHPALATIPNHIKNIINILVKNNISPRIENQQLIGPAILQIQNNIREISEKIEKMGEGYYQKSAKEKKNNLVSYLKRSIILDPPVSSPTPKI